MHGMHADLRGSVGNNISLDLLAVIICNLTIALPPRVLSLVRISALAAPTQPFASLS